jgi:hypothetical protein
MSGRPVKIRLFWRVWTCAFQGRACLVSFYLHLRPRVTQGGLGSVCRWCDDNVDLAFRAVAGAASACEGIVSPRPSRGVQAACAALHVVSPRARRQRCGLPDAGASLPRVPHGGGPDGRGGPGGARDFREQGPAGTGVVVVRLLFRGWARRRRRRQRPAARDGAQGVCGRDADGEASKAGRGGASRRVNGRRQRECPRCVWYRIWTPLPIHSRRCRHFACKADIPNRLQGIRHRVT